MLRFIGLNSLIILHTIVFCLWAALLTLFGSRSRVIHFYVAKPWARVILWLSRVKVTAKGCEQVDSRIPRIYMTNHQSYFDILGLLAYLPVDFKFLMKQELMRIPLFGFAMKRAGYIGIERNDPRKAVKSMQHAAERIRNGASVLIFPEGTRSVDGRLQEFKRGGFKLALKSRCDIVPVVIQGSRRIMPKGSFTIRRGHFTLSVGKPIAVGDYSARDIAALMARVREEMLQELEGAPVS
ncbi:MAG: 1-acyl-sn-glycerol-3-phosphate acyltransferase [Deltaproteobacteria bacterium]|nr:1-acyl-sn-glycerol-3-phosphate acyltransferase [Deltaproteobacteria bacterium]